MNTEFDLRHTPLSGGLSVLEASAGTGKTFTITHLVPRFLLENPALRLSEILVVTYTKDATAELAQRLRLVLQELHAGCRPEAPTPIHPLLAGRDLQAAGKILRRALSDLDRLAVMTIHSFCLRILQTEGTLCGLPVLPELLSNESAWADDLLADLRESTIACDPFLAGLFASGELPPATDHELLRQISGQPNLRPVPAPVSAEALRQQLESFHCHFSADLLADFRELIGPIAKWKKDAPDPRVIEAALETLTQPLCAGSIVAARTIGGLPEFAPARSQADKDLKGAIREHPVVVHARKFQETSSSFIWHFRWALVNEVRRRLGERLVRERRVTYNGMVETLFQALTVSPSAPALARRLRELYRVGLIDESQDTDPRQFAIFQSIFLQADPPLPLVLIGDPKQAIYAFRGAEVNTYLSARALAGGQVFTLNETYRAPTPLVAAVNAFFSAPAAFLKNGLDFAPAQSGLPGDRYLCQDPKDTTPPHSRIEAWFFLEEEMRTAEMRKHRLASVAATKIVDLLNQGAEIVDSDGGREKVRPRDCAVLVSTHQQAAEVTEALRQRGVPAREAQRNHILHTEEAEDLWCLLAAVAEPRRRSLRQAALTTRLLGQSLSDLSNHSDRSDLSALDGLEDRNLARFLEWHELWQRTGISTLLAEVDKACGVSQRLAGGRQGERRLTNLRQLADFLQEAPTEAIRVPTALVRWLAREITSAREDGGLPSDERQLHLESEAEAVTVLTMHSAKGLQFPLIFCPYLWHQQEIKKGRPAKLHALPPSALSMASDSSVKDGNGGTFAPSSPGGPVLVEGSLADSPEFWAQHLREQLEERLRLAYVAITRAQVQAWVVVGMETRIPTSCLDWLLRTELPEHFADWCDKPEHFLDWMKAANQPGRSQRHRAVLEAWSSQGVACAPAPLDFGQKWLPPSSPSPRLQALEAPELRAAWSFTSFSAMTRESHPYGNFAESEPVVEPSLAEVPAAAPPLLLMAAPGGAILGTAIHDWMQDWDFSPPDLSLLRAHLDRYPLPSWTEDWTSAVAEMLGCLRTTLLPEWQALIPRPRPRPLPLPLAQVCADAAASEWHFVLPLPSALEPKALAGLFRRHGHSAYADRLAALPFAELQGYLHGFIDRLVGTAAAWGLIDWKTNLLGRTPSSYAQESLLASAYESHYFLQVHLYLLALRRYWHSFPNPPTPTPPANGWLVFLRGLTPHSGDGVLSIHPSTELLDDLDHLFSPAPRP